MESINKILSDRDNRVALTLILIILFIKSALAILSEGTFGGADDISHYRIARFAFRFPELFFDQWGKPVFTLAASPFAQFGYNGIRIFNVLISSAVCWVSYLIARKLKILLPWTVIIFISFSPIYLVMSYTGMTEILFSLLIILSVWLFISDHYKSSLIILSLLPFSRSEGFLIWIPFIVLMLIKRRAIFIPLLLTGFILFSLAGSLIFKDILWVFNQFPYRGGTGIYGHGELFHFLKQLPGTFGIPLSVMALSGIIAVFYGRAGRYSNDFQTVFYLLFLPSLIYFAAHSFVWWRGMGNSAGLIRVMAGIVPLVAIIASVGLAYLSGFLISRNKLSIYLSAIFLVFFTLNGFSKYTHPSPLTEEQKEIKEATLWLESSPYTNRKVYYYNPFYFYFRRVDPYDQYQSRERVPDISAAGFGLQPGELVMWDSHFSPNEGGLSESGLSENSFFRRVNTFGADSSGSSLPRVAFYERLTDNLTPLDPDILISDSRELWLKSDTIIFTLSNFTGIDPEKFTSDNQTSLYLMENGSEFSPSFHLQLEELMKRDNISVSVEASIILSPGFGEDEILLVASLERRGRNLIYLKQDFYLNNRDTKGFRCSLDFDLPSSVKSGDLLVVYIWNRKGNMFYISDLRVLIKTE